MADAKIWKPFRALSAKAADFLRDDKAGHSGSDPGRLGPNVTCPSDKHNYGKLRTLKLAL